MGTPRITIVGGGSTHWTPSLLTDFANTEALQDAEVTLMDVDPNALPLMADLGAHIAKVRDIGLTVRTTTDLADSLEGAEFVVVALSVGGFASMVHDIEIPARYGIRQPVGDSVGPGGISRALRNVPVVADIARSMEQNCPDALLLNVTNPLTALCRSVGRTSKIKVVGLCNELIGFKFMMSLLFDAPLQKIDPVVAGVNHLPLITELKVAGDDGFAMLHSLVDGPAADREAPIWMSPPPGGVHWRRVSDAETWTKADVLANIRLKYELLRQFGVLPGSADTHIAEFLPQFVTPTSDYGRDWGVRQYGIQTHQEDKWADERGVAEMLASDEITPWPSGELAADLIDGLVTGTERTLPMNLPNRGQVGNLPEDVVVECMGIADSQGVRPRDQATVPSVLGEYLREVSLAQELTVEAALTGDRTLVLEAMLTDQVARQLPYEHLVAMTDELLEATAPWLPQFSS